VIGGTFCDQGFSAFKDRFCKGQITFYGVGGGIRRTQGAVSGRRHRFLRLSIPQRDKASVCIKEFSHPVGQELEHCFKILHLKGGSGDVVQKGQVLLAVPERRHPGLQLPGMMIKLLSQVRLMDGKRQRVCQFLGNLDVFRGKYAGFHSAQIQRTDEFPLRDQRDIKISANAVVQQSLFERCPILLRTEIIYRPDFA